MRSGHILIKKAFIYKKQQERMIDESYIYDKALGYWVRNDDKKPAVYDPNFPGPKTKKEDIETGEDQKGE